MRLPFTARGAVIAALQAALILALAGAGWMIHRQLPTSAADRYDRNLTTLQIVLRQPPDSYVNGLDVAVNFYQVDIVAVRHEFFTEPRAGKRFEDFLRDRIKGRPPVSARLDKQGQGSVALTPGSWLLHVTLPGDEQIEWRLPVKVAGTKQIIELNTQNAYTRSRSF
ncbi:MAG TPA: hypothetical protein VHQ94_23625 [Pyrinomonadaceae bacterium]|nr:hypothetical protein [Pyrinomonadaceae bacterium]